MFSVLKMDLVYLSSLNVYFLCENNWILFFKKKGFIENQYNLFLELVLIQRCMIRFLTLDVLQCTENVVSQDI